MDYPSCKPFAYWPFIAEDELELGLILCYSIKLQFIVNVDGCLGFKPGPAGASSVQGLHLNKIASSHSSPHILIEESVH